MTPLQILKKDFLSHTTRLRYQPGLDGNQINHDGVVVVGNRAGPCRDFSNLTHELCHFVEIDDARQQMWGWGLKVPTVEVFGQLCHEPVTRQATDRELRVMAYQANLQEALGAPTRISCLFRSLKYMDDFHHVPLEDGRPAYGEGAPPEGEVSHSEVTASRLRWMANQVRVLRKEYTFERFRSEWFRKIALL